MHTITVVRDRYVPGYGRAPEARDCRVWPLLEALSSEHPTDAYAVSYVAHAAGETAARLTKPTYSESGFAATATVLFADVDLPGHRAWIPGELDVLGAIPVTEGIYATTHGYRLVQPLEAPIPILELERTLTAWHRALRDRDIDVDRMCRDWTRLYRLPHVRRKPGAPMSRSPIVDLSRMRAVHIEPDPEPVGRLPSPRPSRGPAIATFAASLAPEDDELASRVAATTVLAPGDRHAYSLALAGAMLHLGIPGERVPSIVAHVASLTGCNAPEHHERNARDTVARFARGDALSGIAALRNRWDGAATALERPSVGGATVSAELTSDHDGVVLIEAECGVGKTRAAEDLAVLRASASPDATRSPPGTRTSISVDKNGLALQIAGNLRARGVAVARIFGPLSVTGAGECQLRESAEHYVGGGQSLTRDFCEGRGKTSQRCTHYRGCKARLGVDADEKARVVVGPHPMMSELSERAGTTGLLIIDEPPPLIESTVLTIGDIDAAHRSIGYFEKTYSACMIQVLDAIRASLNGGVSVDMTELIRICPNDETPPVKWMSVAQSRGSSTMAQMIGSASKVCMALTGALKREGGSLSIEAGGVVANVVNSRLYAGIRRDGNVLAMSADIGLSAPLYKRALGYDPPVRQMVGADGVRVSRTWFRVRANRTVYDARMATFEAHVRAALVWAENRKLGVVVYKYLEDRAREIVGERAIVGHYGGLRGLDHWRDLRALATIGDPRPSPRVAIVESEYAGIPWEPRTDQLAAAELEQAHGRLRVVHRKTACRMAHWGTVRPRGRGWDACTVVGDLSGGRPSPLDHVSAERLRALVADRGVRGAARILGATHEAVGTRRRRDG
jgi:hypothetical protein